jgi:hypothetical protein
MGLGKDVEVETGDGLIGGRDLVLAVEERFVITGFLSLERNRTSEP